MNSRYNGLPDSLKGTLWMGVIGVLYIAGLCVLGLGRVKGWW